MRFVLVLMGLFGFGSWPGVVARVERSVVKVDSDTTLCSGFMIHSKKHYVLTAAHCDEGSEMFVNDTPAAIVMRDVEADLEVLAATEIAMPALKLADTVRVGETIADFGLGRVRHAWVSGVNKGFPDEGLLLPHLIADSPVIEGQSGGVVVNNKGEVVTLVQRTSNKEMIGVMPQVIRERTGKYWER